MAVLADTDCRAATYSVPATTTAGGASANAPPDSFVSESAGAAASRLGSRGNTLPSAAASDAAASSAAVPGTTHSSQVGSQKGSGSAQLPPTPPGPAPAAAPRGSYPPGPGPSQGRAELMGSGGLKGLRQRMSQAVKPLLAEHELVDQLVHHTEKAMGEGLKIAKQCVAGVGFSCAAGSSRFCMACCIRCCTTLPEQPRGAYAHC